MTKRMRASSFTPEGQAAASKLLHYIVDYHAQGNISKFTKMLNLSLKERGYTEKKKDGSTDFVKRDRSVIHKLINIGNPSVKPYKTINPLYFEYFLPFYPENLTLRDMLDIASSRKQAPELHTLKFRTCSESNDKICHSLITKKDPALVMVYFLGNLPSSVGIKVICKIEAKISDLSQMNMNGDSTHPMSRKEMERLSLVFEETLRLKNINRRDQDTDELIKAPPEVEWLFNNIAMRWNSFESENGKMSINTELLSTVSYFCYKVSRWTNNKPQLCSLHTYEGNWQEMLQDLNNEYSRSCICPT